MEKNDQSRRWIFVGMVFLIFVGVCVLLLLTLHPEPIQIISRYKPAMLWEEMKKMNDCAECHKEKTFHTCDTCHDDHGAVELVGIQFQEVIELTGDVPDPAFVQVNEILPDQENFGTHIRVFDFLNQYGVEDFESVTFTTKDGRLITIKRQYLDETAMLVPYLDGVRFITKSVHSSTWLKGITKIIIVSDETPLKIDGKTTSIGRLLLNGTMRITVEGSDVMLTDEDGKTNHAFVANWVEGAPLLPLLADPSPKYITITTNDGQTTDLEGLEITNALLGLVKGQVTLILPERGNSVWVSGVKTIESN